MEMTLNERKQLLIEQLRTERERRQQLSDLLTQSAQNEQQLIGAITVIEQMIREEAPASKQPDKDPPGNGSLPGDKADG